MTEEDHSLTMRVVLFSVNTNIMKNNDLYKKHDEELLRLGVTDPHQRQVVLDFIYKIAQIAVEVYLENEQHD